MNASTDHLIAASSNLAALVAKLQTQLGQPQEPQVINCISKRLELATREVRQLTEMLDR